MQKKYKIFLSDLNYVNDGHEWSIIPFPLNIGYQAAYLQELLPDQFEIKLFKDPRKLLKALENERPDVIGFSNYIWNKNLQLQFAKYAKERYPECIMVMGGPNYNFSEREWMEDFARRNDFIDFHVEGEGEPKFYNLMACCLEYDFDLSKVIAASPSGVTFLNPDTGELTMNQMTITESQWNCLDSERFDMIRGRLLELDDIPSPYLSGILDEFLKDPYYCPIVETNRGCPYSCTFCAWGAMSKSKSSHFSTERVLAELEYIAEKNVARAPYLYFGDANFGLFPRDVEIAHEVVRLREKTGFPENVFLYFAKNSTEKVVKIAEILKDLTPISLARQSQSEEVLKNVKRSNIAIDTFNRLASLSKELGIDSSVDIIYGLPGESIDTVFDGIREIVQQNVDALHLYATSFLDGSEMATLESREKFGMKGEWRLIDGCAGNYGPIRAMEYEEIVTSSNTMSRDDFFRIRVFHFLQCLFLDYKIYKDVAILLDDDHTIVDVITDIIENYEEADAPFRNLINDFIAAAKAEMHPAEPAEFSDEDISAAIQKSVKLNPLYIAKLLHDPGVRESFNEFLAVRLPLFGTASAVEIEAVLEFIDSTVFDFDDQTFMVRPFKIDAFAFAKRLPAEKEPISSFMLDEPQAYKLFRKFSYQEFIEEKGDDVSLSDKVYDILVHHTHETHRNTLVYSVVGQAADEDGLSVTAPTLEQASSGGRVLRNESGWVY